MMQIVLFSLLGLAGGLFSGALGIGGATVLVPLLVYVMGFDQHKAQGTTTALLLPPLGLLAFLEYYRAGHVDIKAAGLMCLGMLLGGYFGAMLANHLPADWLRKIFGGVMMLVSLNMIFGGK
ncbi:MAG TPA: sulfite exporter TauE/SafE family protein [Bacteroidota bacterium]|nr:sulfite exporter TauE/SafE family protein [Bacteroidota bacterium]